MHRFDGRTVDGAIYFNQAGPVHLPKFAKLERRTGLVKGGRPIEIDLLGEWTEASGDLPSLWLVQVKHQKTAIGEDAVRDFLAQSATLLQQQPHAIVVCWFFSKNGFTHSARQLLQSAGVFYSDLTAFNRLARLFDFFGLPQ